MESFWVYSTYIRERLLRKIKSKTMNRKFVFAFIFLALVSISFGQGVFEFEKESKDFGVVIEGEQPTHEFTFKNTGDQPIIMSNVKASCGCTTPLWTKTPVMPGESGVIKVVYNSKGRIGAFNKSITITSNASVPTKVLKIKGVVEKKDAEVFTAEQLANSPKLVLNKTSHHFGRVEKNKTNVYKFQVSNEGKSPLEISDVKSGCHCTSFSVADAEILPGQSTTLTINYVPRLTGEQLENIVVYSNDLNNKRVKVQLSAEVVESFSGENMLMQERAIGF